MSSIISHLSLFALKLKVFQEKAGERWEIFVSRHLSLTPAGQETSSEVLSFILLTLHWFVQECCSIILAGWTGLGFVFFIETIHVTALSINIRCYINENHTAIEGNYQPSQYSMFYWRLFNCSSNRNKLCFVDSHSLKDCPNIQL